MTTISPLLQSKINSTSADFHKRNEFHERMYENLKQHANDVRPNEAKAKLIKEGPVTHLIHNIQDDATDCKNFFKAVKTGQLRDNSLGRINDIGLKASVLLIASFLASGAKTKTEAIMKFVGGGSFLAVMSLWPKLFINLPARVVHGFPIDRRYISAQGDKKDFHLDNQFKVWDAVGEDELAKDAKRAGIDYYSENGREKIIRKEDKTALQNRALWMATAGFATPLLTADIGNAVGPKIQDAVIKSGFEKSKKILSSEQSLKDYLNQASVDVRNQKAIEKLFEQFSAGSLKDEDFYSTLADMLALDAPIYKVNKDGSFTKVAKDMFRNVDDLAAVPILKQSAEHPESIRGLRGLSPERLKAFAKQYSTIDTASLKEKFRNIKLLDITGELLDITPEEFSSICEAIDNLGKNFSVDDLANELGIYNISKEEAQSLYDSVAVFKADDFKQAVLDFNSNVVGETRGRLKAYLNLLNPIAGHREESIYTKEYNQTLDNLFSKIDDFTAPDGTKVRSLKSRLQLLNPFTLEKGDKYSERIKEFFESKTPLAYLNSQKTRDGNYVNILSSFFAEKTPPRTINGKVNPEYVEFITSLLPKDFVDAANKKSCTDTLAENVDKIKDGVVVDEKYNELFKSLFGTEGSKATVMDQIRNFLHIEEANIECTKARAIFCADFEARLKDGSFAEFNLTPEEINSIRTQLYSGNISQTHSKVTFGNRNKGEVQRLNQLIFGNGFGSLGDNNKELTDKLSKLATELKDLTKKTGLCNSNTQETSVKAVDLASRLKEYVTRLNENKSWAKVALGATGVLIAVTLISQFFFGKIDKEFPENKKGEVK